MTGDVQEAVSRSPLVQARPPTQRREETPWASTAHRKRFVLNNAFYVSTLPNMHLHASMRIEDEAGNTEVDNHEEHNSKSEAQGKRACASSDSSFRARTEEFQPISPCPDEKLKVYRACLRDVQWSLRPRIQFFPPQLFRGGWPRLSDHSFRRPERSLAATRAVTNHRPILTRHGSRSPPPSGC